jgi:LysM repeat protein
MKMLKGALALLFVAAAAGGAFAFARHDPAPVAENAVAPVPSVAQVTARPAPQKVEAPPQAEEKTDLDRGALLDLRRTAKKAGAPDAKATSERLERIAKANLQEAEAAKEKGDDKGERIALSRAFFATPDRQARNALRPRLDELSQRLFFNTKNPDDIYTVQKGDVLVKIARSHKVAWSYVKRLNGLKTDAIRIGQKLRIPKGTLELTVFKADFLLILTQDGIYVKAWDVGTGREDRTPEATFSIHERVSEPTWYAPDGKVYPFGEKENILGTRWLGFEKTVDYAGFGIHGTAFPETIGTESSAGCIRMRNEDVEEVYDLVAEGTQVTIVR